MTDVAPAPQSLKERQRQERERLILRAAEDLLLEKGYHETSMEEIAARVGISKGTVYLHFVSKEELVFALLQRGLRSFLSALDSTLDLSLSPREKLEELFRKTYTEMFTVHKSQLYGAVSVVFRSPEFHTFLADRRERFVAMWEEPMARVARLVAEGQAAGELDPSLPVSVVVGVFASLLNPRSFQYASEREGRSPEEIVEHIGRILFNGVAAKQADGSPCGSRGGNE